MSSICSGKSRELRLGRNATRSRRTHPMTTGDRGRPGIRVNRFFAVILLL
jgi:hypothetical protein